MEQRTLGRTGLLVSRLVFGTLTLAPCQAGLPPEEAGDLLAYAFSRGVTFWDTAEIYDNYPHIRAGLRRLAQPPIICTKTYAYTRQMAQASLDQARRALGLDVIDVVLLHEQETCLTMDGHREAFTWLLQQKETGAIRAVGLSTHAVEPVRALAAARSPAGSQAVWSGIDPGPYRQADVIHPLLNLRGIGILDGSIEAMAAACREAHDQGIGIYGMKMLGGGHLLPQFCEAAEFALSLDFADAFAVGMQSQAEVDMNVALFSGEKPDPALLARTMNRQRRLLISDWCDGCGACVSRCGEKALSIRDGRAVVDPGRCIFCGYCAAVCRDFAIKVI
jgi:predicted aldo/keto reductase-like oxidoreductase